MTALTIKEVGEHDAQTGTRLRETLSNGNRKATLIQAGWGASGYYSESLLAKDGPVAFPKGLHMYLDHPTLTEETDRPERSLRDLVGVTATTPRLDGIDLTAEVEVFSHWQPVIEEMAPHIGLSIRAMGEAEHGDMAGKHGPIVTALTEGISCDYVTAAGAGGRLRENAKLIGLMEAARTLTGEGEPEERELVEAEHLFWELGVDLAAAEVIYESLRERDVSKDERIALAKKGQAIPVRNDSGEVINGRFPMANCDDVSNAAQSIGRGSQSNDTLKNFIRRVASKLSCPTPFQQESVAPPAATTKEVQMDQEEKDRLSKLEESVSKLDEKVKEAESAKEEADKRAERAEDKLLAQEARKVVEAALKAAEESAKDAGTGLLPERAQTRVVESVLREKLPVDVDGELITATLKERTAEQAEAERKYLFEKDGEQGKNGNEGGGHVPARDGGAPFREGDGGDNGGETPATADQEKKLGESFQRLGMSEDTAKVAVRGR